MTLEEFEKEYLEDIRHARSRNDPNAIVLQMHWSTISKLIKLARAARDRNQEKAGSPGALHKAVKEVFGNDN